MQKGVLVNEIDARSVARQAKRIFPLMGRLMESQMHTPVLKMPPVHFHVLNRIDRRPHTLHELAAGLSVSSASLSRTVTVMEERGWVTRTRSTEDRRLVHIGITEEGHAVLRDMEQRTEDFLTDTLSRLSQAELSTLAEGLGILISAFSDELSHVPSDVES